MNDLAEWEFQRLYGPWSPFHPTAVRAVLDGGGFTWWVAGGWSLEGDPRRPRRRHEDVDVSVLADELDAVRERLAGFHLWQPQEGALRPLRPGEPVSEGCQQLWVRRDAYSPWVMDLVVTPRDGDDWVFKHDDRVRRPLAQVWCRGPDGVPYQRPEIGLLFKARLRRDKDVTDLDAVWPRLDEPARSWLRDSLAVVSPGHPWLARLAAG